MQWRKDSHHYHTSRINDTCPSHMYGTFSGVLNSFSVQNSMGTTQFITFIWINHMTNMCRNLKKSKERGKKSCRMFSAPLSYLILTLTSLLGRVTTAIKQEEEEERCSWNILLLLFCSFSKDLFNCTSVMLGLSLVLSLMFGLGMINLILMSDHVFNFGNRLWSKAGSCGKDC